MVFGLRSSSNCPLPSRSTACARYKSSRAIGPRLGCRSSERLEFSMTLMHWSSRSTLILQPRICAKQVIFQIRINKMPSRSNPNTPSSLRPKAARTIRSKRQNTQRIARNKVTKPAPRTSQAIRKAAPLSRKKARKLDKKIGYAKQRAMEETGEVEMKDIEEAKSTSNDPKDYSGDTQEARMELDATQ